jgi:uncharacterized lipoprotein NlpE involved in copper resistance
MNRIPLLCLTLLVVLLGGCAAAQPEGHRTESSGYADAGHTARTALDWEGIYAGVIPCASCPGIEMRVTLAANGTYSWWQQYQEEEDPGTMIEGTFRWVDGFRVQLDAAADHQMFFVGENQLFLLDREGNRVQGVLAPHYILKKTQYP